MYKIAVAGASTLLGKELKDALEESPLAVGPALVSSVDAFSLGIMGGAFCVVTHVRAARAERASLVGVDRLVERMQALADALPRALPLR